MRTTLLIIENKANTTRQLRTANIELILYYLTEIYVNKIIIHTMHVSNINKFKGNYVVSVVCGSRRSFSQTVNVKNGGEQCEETQELKICK